MVEPLLTYGLSDGVLKSILDVQNGLACNCICPKCKSPLIARNNPTNRKAPHFAHSSDNNCVGAYESALHLLAKEVLLEQKKIRTPNFHHDYRHNNIESFFREGKVVKFEQISIEQPVSDNNGNLIIADAIGEINSKKVIIEFANTHFIDEEKLSKLLKLKIPCIEIDLSNQTLDKKVLKKFILNESDDIYWVCNPRLDNEYRALQERNKAIEEKQKNITNEVAVNSRESYEKYKLEGKYKFYTLTKGVARKCPIITNGLAELRNTRFYQHNILKRLIDGEYWNGKTYGNFDKDCYIFLKNEKIVVLPEDSIRNTLSESEEQFAKFFYAGLMKVLEVTSNEGVCNLCDYRIDWLAFDNKEITVCSYHLGEKNEAPYTILT